MVVVVWWDGLLLVWCQLLGCWPENLSCRRWGWSSVYNVSAATVATTPSSLAVA